MRDYRRLTCRAVLSAILFVVFSVGSATAAEKKTLVAPLYPGSAKMPSSDGYTEFQAYCSNDAPDKVAAFYEKKLGRRAAGGFVGVGRKGLSVLDGSGKRIEAGVHFQQQENRSEFVERIFEELKELSVPGMPGARSQADYRTLEKEFGYLVRMYYPADQENRSLDEVFYEKYRARLEGAVAAQETDTDDMESRIQALAAQGKFDEMMELSQKMAAMQQQQAEDWKQGNEGGIDHWRNWVECLRELAKKACRTRIAIDFDPSGWEG